MLLVTRRGIIGYLGMKRYKNKIDKEKYHKYLLLQTFSRASIKKKRPGTHRRDL